MSKTVTVWQISPPVGITTWEDPRAAAYLAARHDGIFPGLGHYVEVGTVKAATIEHAFEATQAGGPRSQWDEVPARSVCVGDVFQIGGLFWMVKPVGFSRIDAPAMTAGLEV